MSTVADDPRDPSAETKLTFPKTWDKDSADSVSASVMFASGLIMVTRNRYLAWPALLLSINSAINQHPLRTKDGGQSTLTSIMLALSALIASYMPLIVVGRAPVETVA